MFAIDIYFIMNAAYDMTLLALTGMAAGCSLSVKRLVKGSLLAAAWSSIAVMISIYCETTRLTNISGKIITYTVCPYLMCRTAYGKDSKISENLICFYAVSVLTGGMMFAVRMAGITAPSWILMPVCAIASVKMWKYKQKKEDIEKTLYDIELEYHGKKLSAKAIYDTGNTLRTRKNEPVHVLSPSIWKCLVGEDKWSAEEVFPIQYKTISKASVMPGIYIESICIKRADKCVNLRNVPAGLAEIDFGEKREYQLIINRDAFEEK